MAPSSSTRFKGQPAGIGGSQTGKVPHQEIERFVGRMDLAPAVLRPPVGCDVADNGSHFGRSRQTATESRPYTGAVLPE
jgi:hypothetical protein